MVTYGHGQDDGDGDDITLKQGRCPSSNLYPRRFSERPRLFPENTGVFLIGHYGLIVVVIVIASSHNAHCM